MPSPHSQDLRQRVIQAYKASNNKAQTCKTFTIARTTLDKWLKLQEETGNLKPRVHCIRGHSHKVKDLEAFRVWVESETPFERIEDLRPKFKDHFGESISYSNLHKWLNRIGWSHKKRCFLQTS